jgi:peptidyl-tRNA hydrolase, PTH1 family
LADTWLVAGLGNPGKEYDRTRHNVGAMVSERLAERLGGRFKKVRMLPLLAAEVRHGETSLLLTAPGTFMNVSGPPIASFARKRGVSLDHVVACHDEIDLPFGALRVKWGGSTAGHHGLDSMVRAFRSADFYRVRIGIGRPAGRWENVDFVLSPFARKEMEEVVVLIEDAAGAVLCLIDEGLSAAQARYNRSGAAAT